MASAAPAVEKASDLMQKLSLETKTKTNDAPAATKKNPVIPAGNKSVTPVLQNVDPNMYYYSNGYTSPYYFGGHDGMSDWGDYSRYVSQDGVEMTTGLYGDMYGYGYSPYGAYSSPASPVPTIGQDGQLYSPQQYQYPAPYFQPPSPAPYNPPTQSSTSKVEVPPSTSSAEQTPLTLEASKVKANGAVPNGTASSNGSLLSTQKLSQQSPSLTSSGAYSRGAGTLANGFSSYDAMRSPSPWYDGSANNVFSSNGGVHAASNATTLGRNQNSRSYSNTMSIQNQRPTSGIGSTTSMMMNRMYPTNRLYSAYSAGLGHRSSFYDSRTNGRWGYVDTKYKPGGRGNGFYGYPNESFDGLSELNRGPRANRTKNPKGVVPTVTVTSKEQTPSANGSFEGSSVAVPDKDQYNKEDFPLEYSDAKFFIIKSYSEDDVHKSVKYNVWASTPNGNKKLDAAYREAKEKTAACPIFLFFSVNASGQFVGVAEMMGPVDFNKNVDYWQQDKWTGCFSVKWHIVKDVPNTILKHIVLANNENKPVTNSRDTQEVKLEQGLQMIKIFKEHASKTSILDDFGFYETRQKVMQEKRAKQHQQQQLHKPVLITKPLDIADVKNKEGDTGKSNLMNSSEKITILKSNSVGVGEKKPNEENGLATTAESKAVVTNGSS